MFKGVWDIHVKSKLIYVTQCDIEKDTDPLRAYFQDKYLPKNMRFVTRKEK
jgi:hypothetical protein